MLTLHAFPAMKTDAHTRGGNQPGRNPKRIERTFPCTFSWCRRRGRWGTCRRWPRRRRAGCTRRRRTRIGHARRTASPGATCRYRCAWSSCSSPPASRGRTGRSRSCKRRALGGGGEGELRIPSAIGGSQGLPLKNYSQSTVALPSTVFFPSHQ